MSQIRCLEKSYYHGTHGHMVKAKREIKEDLKLVDVVIELLDARCPLASQNPDIKEIIQNKKRIVVLNKSDLADEKITKEWIEYFNKQGILAISVDSNSGLGVDKVSYLAEKVLQEELEKSANKGRIGRTIRACIVGIPNVGKSSFINRIAKKTAVEVANKPGVTRKNKWIRVNNKIELLDTPGVLWPKFENKETALYLSFTGTIKEDILDKVEIAYELIKYLIKNNQKDRLIKRYGITLEKITQIEESNMEENQKYYSVLLEIGRKRGAIISGGNIDEEKVSRILLEEFKGGKLGKISLERPK